MKKAIIALIAAILLMAAWGSVSASAQTASVSGTVADTDYQFEVEYLALLSPFKVRIDQNDQVFAINNCGDTVYQILENGELAVKFTQPGLVIVCVDFDSENTLWLTTNKKQLYKLDGNGELELVVSHGVNPLFYIDSQDNIIAVDDSVQKITPDGKITVLAKNLEVIYFMVGLNDEIFVETYQGQIIRIDSDGNQTMIAQTNKVDAGLAMAPDGTVYIMDFNLSTLDLQTGEIKVVQWYSSQYHLDAFYLEFDSLGRMYAYHGNNGIYRIDLQKKTVEPIYIPRGNTSAMTVNGAGEVYLAYGDNLPNGSTTIYQLIAGELHAIKTVKGGKAKGLAASGNDTLYIAVDDTATDAYIYSLNLRTVKYKQYLKTMHGVQSLAVNPVNGWVWWSYYGNRVCYVNANGSVVSVPVIENPKDIHLKFGFDGTLYAIIWEQRQTNPGPGPHSLYKLGGNAEWIELADMLTNDPAITCAVPVAGLDGAVYAIAAIDGSMISPYRGSSFDAVLLLNDDGSFALIGYDFPYDCGCAACDPSTGDILFNHSGGVYRMTPPAAE
ncbi:MAG: WD40 repeat domain-containing protein [Clostridiales bacterium]|nr:WD40 repeat domain-containing protein [Clostridiales bacterium]